MLKSILAALRKPSRTDAVRATYGPEPYRSVVDVAAAERITAILEGTAKELLREVIGLEEIRKMPEALIPKRFRKELPVAAEQVVSFVRENGLPRGSGSWGVDVKEEAGEWHLIVADIRGRSTVGIYPTIRDAEVNAIFLQRSNIEPYVIGALK